MALAAACKFNRITVGSSSDLNKSESSFLSHTVLLQAVLAAMYSASAMLWATEPCFLLDQEIIAEPRQKQYPDVLFWSTALPIQSESVKQHTSTGCVSETIRYILSNISTAIMCISLGSHMNQLRAFIATGQVLVKYIKDPISCLYMMGIIESDFESESFSFFR
jgi:hypothetical protein